MRHRGLGESGESLHSFTDATNAGRIRSRPRAKQRMGGYDKRGCMDAKANGRKMAEDDI